MQLGYGLITCQRYPGDSRTWADLYREAVEMAKLCEEAGLDSVWTSEHHFVDDGYMPSLTVTSAAIAQATGRIEVGTGVLLAPLYHPLRLAEDAATVDCIAGGRFILGVGAGWRAEEVDRLGIPQHGLRRRLSEDPDRDLEEAIRRFAYVRWKYADMANAEGRPSDALPEPPPLDDATRAGVARQLIYGTPQQVAEKVSAFGAALGEGAQLVARSYYPGLSFERSAAMIELLGEVKRLVRSPAGAGQPNRG